MEALNLYHFKKKKELKTLQGWVYMIIKTPKSKDNKVEFILVCVFIWTYWL